MEQSIPVMVPAPGARLVRFVGDRVRFFLKARGGRGPLQGVSARLRTNLGRADVLRREIIEAHTRGLPLAGASWRDLPMKKDGQGWSLELPLAEVGCFKAKAYWLDERNWQHWPDGSDVGISVHPNACRTANTIYCAFPRLFGPSRTAASTRNEKLEDQIQQIEEHGYNIIPPSGKLRDLIEFLPHIVEALGCRILHLLPVNPVPTTYARFGRFGSPYAALDLTAIDPALVVFDKRTTGVDQFRELTYATHLRGGRVLLDIIINHTGWGSALQENHPEWFLRRPDGAFASPGAWGVTWEDLVELKHDNVALWDSLAETFLTWCRRGVDGFRCDAGYKVPVPAWQYIVARVQQEYPETIFLLEGLGGAWEATETLLTEGGMHWAYSELFQNYSGQQVAGYLDHSLNQSERLGLLVNYSETHDNDRLPVQRTATVPPAAAIPPISGTTDERRGREWSLLRNRLCALASVSGGFGFTCGVEWLATERIRVHGSTGLAWGNPDNLVPELARLNALLAGHPCFFDGAKLTRLSAPDSPVYALRRESAEGKDAVLVLVNTDVKGERTLSLKANAILSTGAESSSAGGALRVDLLGQPLPEIKLAAGAMVVTVPAGAAYCLAPAAQPAGMTGGVYRRARAQAAWAIQAVSEDFSVREIGPYDWRTLAQWVERSPFDFLAAVRRLDPQIATTDLEAGLEEAARKKSFPRVVRWSLADRRRVTPVPPGHWLLVEDAAPFRASLRTNNGSIPRNVESIPAGREHVACFAPPGIAGDARLVLERYADDDRQVEAGIRFLAPLPENAKPEMRSPKPGDLVLLTNGIGGMARLCVDLGRVNSKYDCVLGANLHPALPVDRHVFAKRIRVWVNADGFISPLDFQNLVSFEPGPPAVWHFVANAGDGRTVEVQMRAEMRDRRNSSVFTFFRPTAARATGKQLPAEAEVRLTVRVDLEDRSFHGETKRNGAAEFHFTTHTRELPGAKSESRNRVGFRFAPAADRQLEVFTVAGDFHPQPEWSENIPHPVEGTRGQVASGDAWSPGWFELPLRKGASVTLVVTAEPDEAAAGELKLEMGQEAEDFDRRLLRAARAFLVRRGAGKTVIAGYPWFLDWGRDSFIAARGLLAAGLVEDVKEILRAFAAFERDGTLPNDLHGDDASNRDTSDAPLWFALACEGLAGQTTDAASRNAAENPDDTLADDFYAAPVGREGRTVRTVVESIAAGYLHGTPNGIRMDPETALIWSPGHFTWMDTNYPAGTQREGYPVEIQALWIRLLRQMSKIGDENGRRRWSELAERALVSLEKFFWLEDRGWYADLLMAEAGQSAAGAVASDALRSNCLFPISLGVVRGERAQRCVAAALRHLVVPGALRSLAPLAVSVPLPIYGNDGRLLNDPTRPYWGHYEGDEDTRRKPAYHNGTAWTWTCPVFCEALARAWDFDPDAVAAARAYLSGMDRLLTEGCLGQIPEILDGDAPHVARGCDAQAWSVTEALRVWKLLK